MFARSYGWCMKGRAAVLLVLLVLVAGCAQLPTGRTGSTTTQVTTGSTGATTTASPGPSTVAPNHPPDPKTDVLGWENGYWYNETLNIDRSDGLNTTEIHEIVSRAEARDEYIRHLEFTHTVPVKVISRGEYQKQYANSENATPTLRTFDNVKFEALFLVGENNDSLAVQSANRGSNVLGFYSPKDDSIVVISNGDSAQIDEPTLGHELMHALQFSHFNTSSYNDSTRELHNAHNGLIEGEARNLDHRYKQLCNSQWSCVTPTGNQSGGGSGNLNLGVYIMKYFPYSDGPHFVNYVKKHDGGWKGVNALYRNPPASSEQVIEPKKYGKDAPTDVSLPDRSNADWSRVKPKDRAPYAEVGQASIAAMFDYPAYDRSGQGYVVSPQTFLNLDGNGSVNSSDPLNYDYPAVQGWDGDKMWVYRDGQGQTAYTWRIAWDSPNDAQQFVTTYRKLLAYWGGQRVNGRDDLWRIPDGASGFSDAFYVHVDGATVTIVNAPTTDQLPQVYEGAPTS